MTGHSSNSAACARISAVLFAVASAIAPPLQARDDVGAGFPLLVVTGDAVVRFDSFFASDDWADRRIDVTPHAEALIGYYPMAGLSLQSRIKVEAVRAPKPGRDRFLSGTGVFLDELYIDYDSAHFGLYAGKFNPAFGLAWRQFGELLKEGFAEEYEITEMLGLGGALKFDLDAAGRHEFNAAVFFLDTTILRRSLLAQPRAGEERAERISHLRRRDGGLANTGQLNSLALALDGGDFDYLPGLAYHLGFRHLHRGADQSRSEHALAFGLAYEFMANGATISPFAEIARFWNMDGETGNGYVFSAGIAVGYEKFSWQGGFSFRHVGIPAVEGPNRRDWMVGTELVYELCEGLGLGVGYRHERVERVHTDQLRLFLAYEFGLKHSFAK